MMFSLTDILFSYVSTVAEGLASDYPGVLTEGEIFDETYILVEAETQYLIKASEEDRQKLVRRLGKRAVGALLGEKAEHSGQEYYSVSQVRGHLDSGALDGPRTAVTAHRPDLDLACAKLRRDNPTLADVLGDYYLRGNTEHSPTLQLAVTELTKCVNNLGRKHAV